MKTSVFRVVRSGAIAAFAVASVCASPPSPFLPSAWAEDITFPPNIPGVLNVKVAPYNAFGDGVHDDTTAIQAAMDAAVSQSRTVYFPNGTYRCSNQLKWNGSQKRLTLQGQSQAGVVLKLDDNASGYGSAATLKEFVLVSSRTTTSAILFGNYVKNLTLDVGANNLGAVGMTFHTSNWGGISDVTIRSSDAQHRGARGLLLTKQWPGPGIVKNVTVDGFDQGIRIGANEYGMTFENITVQNQTGVSGSAGFINQGNVVSLRGFTSTNGSNVTAFQNATGVPGSLSVIVDANLNATATPATNTAAIDNLVGDVYLRNIRTTGYDVAVRNRGTNVAGINQTEFVSSPVKSLFPGPLTGLNLPVQETPDVAWDDPSVWKSVVDFGADPTGAADSSVAIQNALDASGATTVYFPPGVYQIGSTVRIRNAVRRVFGFNAIIRVPNAFAAGTPVFRFEPGTAPVVVFERFQGESSPPSGFGNSSAIGFEQATSSSVVLKNISTPTGYGYRSGTGAGTLFIEDMSTGNVTFTNQTVYARQINPENSGTTRIVNDGGTLWILGVKTEKGGTLLETKNGGHSEVLGGLVYSITYDNTNVPCVINTDSDTSYTLCETADAGGKRYGILTRETRSGTTLDLLTSNANLPTHNNNGSWQMALYAGYRSASDVSGQVSVTRGGYGYNRNTKRYVQTITLTNNGTTPLSGPLSLVLDNLSANATLYQATGTLAYHAPNSPYKNTSTVGGDLLPGASLTLTLEFTKTNDAVISYTTRVLGGAGLR